MSGPGSGRQDDRQYADGLRMRKQVMGEAFVARALEGAAAAPFAQPLQDYITREAWGTVWQRPGLDLRTRSLATVAMLAAMGRTHELQGHVRGARNNGATVGELQEVLLHAAVYCGVPLAAEAFRAAQQVLGEEALTPPNRA